MTLYRDARDAVKAVFAAGFLPVPAIPVLWHENNRPIVPDPGEHRHWVHVSVSFGTDALVAFGAGRMENERTLSGIVEIRVFAESGSGEDEALDIKSAAVAALRSVRDGSLSFLGDIIHTDDGGTDDGNWWIRGAMVAFEYRFRG